MTPTTTKNDDGRYDGVYVYEYTASRWPQTYYGRALGRGCTCGHGSIEEARKARLILRLVDGDIERIENGKWRKVQAGEAS